ncbi:hypothetical protein K488DRAFT_84246 [Vararia minispora EC-137]|uniref:Uncharacterized protein n=1 Tax=Vararia minispora EC-137 TaxID=1314806 RepID=A0ACB8QQT1_9AGAM|nr:hypothetical protein K488DRAFT_84246 [Vararia minispora EC-137]
MASVDWPSSEGRAGFAASSAAFSLPSPASSAVPASLFADDQPPSPRFLPRFRPPAALFGPKSPDPRLATGSPLAASFALARPRPLSAVPDDRDDRMWADRSPSSSSDNPTPPLLASHSEISSGNDSDFVPQSSSHPQTPVRASDALNPHFPTDTPAHTRRLSAPPKLAPRIQSLLAESRDARTDESEVKSEFQFQKLVKSFSALPTQPRTPRGRGRYPEEAGEDDSLADDDDDAPSDGDDEYYDGDAGPPAAPDPEPYFNYAAPRSAPIAIVKPRTPAASVAGSAGGDESTLLLDSPNGVTAMDVDVPSSIGTSPSFCVTNLHQWRYTPPPTASAVVRTNKRKYDERFDPYPASKRRAVSPALASLHTSLSPIYIPRPRAVPVPIPGASLPNSLASSPTVSHSGSLRHAINSVASSPTLRASVALASPITRPMRLSGRSFDEGQREVNGAGDGVSGLSLD